MFLFRRRVAAEPEVAPVAPPPRVHDEDEEKLKIFTKCVTILFAGCIGGLLFWMFLHKFWNKPDNFELQSMDQYHRFMAAILLIFFIVYLYYMIFISYEKAQSVSYIATPFFVSPFFLLRKFVKKVSSELFLRFLKFTYFPIFRYFRCVFIFMKFWHSIFSKSLLDQKKSAPFTELIRLFFCAPISVVCTAFMSYLNGEIL